MQLDHPQHPAFDPGPRGPVALWMLLALIGVVLGSAALIAALAGSGSEVPAARLALRTVSIL